MPRTASNRRNGRVRKTNRDIQEQVGRIQRAALARIARSDGFMGSVDPFQAVRRFKAAENTGARMLDDNAEYVRGLRRRERQAGRDRNYLSQAMARSEIDRIENRRTPTREDIRRMFGGSTQTTSTENTRQVQPGQRNQGGGGGGSKGNSAQ